MTSGPCHPVEMFHWDFGPNVLKSGVFRLLRVGRLVRVVRVVRVVKFFRSLRTGEGLGCLQVAGCQGSRSTSTKNDSKVHTVRQLLIWHHWKDLGAIIGWYSEGLGLVNGLIGHDYLHLCHSVPQLKSASTTWLPNMSHSKHNQLRFTDTVLGYLSEKPAHFDERLELFFGSLMPDET